MFQNLKKYCQNLIPFSENELDIIDDYFKVKTLKKKEFLLQNENICDFVAFVNSGSIRHFHIKNGDEKTCDISFENNWVTDFQSFIYETPAIMNLQAMEETTVYFIKKQNLYDLYKQYPNYESFGRLMAENVAQRATEIAMSLSSEKPEERFQNLLIKQPDLFQRIPQKYIANFLGISPESISRIQKRIYNNKKS